MLLLDTGARRDELMSRRLTDLDQDLDVLLVLGKGRRERALPYGHKTALALDRYLRVRERHKDAHLPCCGSGFAADSPRGAWSACWSVAAGRPGWLACTPTSSATP
jgi:integrase